MADQSEQQTGTLAARVDVMLVSTEKDGPQGLRTFVSVRRTDFLLEIAEALHTAAEAMEDHATAGSPSPPRPTDD
jgi:hypothetical protein